MSDGKPLVYQFGEEIQNVINRFQDQGITIAEVIGTLECIKMEIITDAMDAEDDGEEWAE